MIKMYDSLSIAAKVLLLAGLLLALALGRTSVYMIAKIGLELDKIAAGDLPLMEILTRIESIAAQGGDERLGAPVPKRGVVDQALADRGPAGGLHKLGIERCLVDESQPLQCVTHERLAPGDPEGARPRNIRPLLLGGEQRFFYG